MTTPQLALLGFATWTLFVLMVTVGIHRWSLILTGRAAIDSFPAHAPEGPGWYQRATRAHANCIENLPVFGAIVAVATFAHVQGPWIDALSLAILAARVVQTSVHVGFPISARSVSVRFSFYSVQLVAMLAMLAVIVVDARSR